ncbi:MAG: hypothetical protein K2Q01_12290 [Rickettsiales bacterium]|nr:hypothetical protein [Rickettsiales bacterium]
MTFYNVKNTPLPLSSVEFAPVSDGNVAFFTAASHESREKIMEFLASPGMHQRVTGEACVDGKPVLITSGSQTQQELMEALKTRGVTLEQQQLPDKNRTWKIISMLAVPGQFLQLASGLMRKDKKLDWGMLVFAGSNLVGHAITWHYGAQSYEDKNRLKFVKGEINTGLSPYVAKGDSLPDIHDSRKELRNEHTTRTPGQRIDSFLEANSIYVGEIFCRYLGAFALAFPPDRWGAGSHTKKMSAAYEVARNTNNYVHNAGLASLTGKTISLMAKAEDPYDTRPPGALDTFREKIAFRMGGWIEAGAFGTLTYDALTNPNRRIVFRGKEYKDYVGALGSALFTSRYIMRHWAKFGERKTDMDEVYAHAADCLAKMPQARIGELVANTATALTEHFKDEHATFGEVYTRLKSDLYNYHHIVVPGDIRTQPPKDSPRLYSKREGTPAKPFALQQDNTKPSSGSYAQYVRATGEVPMWKGA